MTRNILDEENITITEGNYKNGATCCAWKNFIIIYFLQG
jgi:hypothetical protein